MSCAQIQLLEVGAVVIDDLRQEFVVASERDEIGTKDPQGALFTSPQRQHGGTRIGATAAEPNAIDAENWRCRRLAIVAENIQKADSDDERLEYVATQSWLPQ